MMSRVTANHVGRSLTYHSAMLEDPSTAEHESL